MALNHPLAAALSLGLGLGVCMSLAACGPPKSKSASGDILATAAAERGFPRPTASYVAKYETYRDDGTTGKEMTIYAAGTRMRVESTPSEAGRGKLITMATVLDPANKRMLSFRTGPDAPKVAMVMSAERLGEAARMFDLNKDRPTSKIVGHDQVAGLSCTVWETQAVGEGRKGEQTCITGDGIMLRSGEAGAKTPRMQAVDVIKGAQSDALFAVPAGYEIVDFAPCMTLMQDAMAAARAGAKPDMAKMAQCQKLGQKVGAMFSSP